MHQHTDIGLVLKTFSPTLRVLWILACSIPTYPRAMHPYLKLIIALLVMSMQDTYLIRTRRVLKPGYVFTNGGIAISLRSTKQTIVAISFNHVEILALHEVTREYFWLRAVMGHIQNSCDLYPVVHVLKTIYEDNAVRRFRSLLMELVCINFLSCNIASSL